MKSRKNGFTIVEIVIALAVISIVSLTATTIVLSSQRIQKKSRDKFFAVNFCNNCIALCQSVANKDNNGSGIGGIYEDFEKNMSGLLGLTIELDEGAPYEGAQYSGTIFFDGDWKQSSEQDSRFRCEMSFGEGYLTDDTSRKIIKFKVVVLGGSGELWSASYSIPLGGAL